MLLLPGTATEYRPSTALQKQLILPACLHVLTEFLRGNGRGRL